MQHLKGSHAFCETCQTQAWGEHGETQVVFSGERKPNLHSNFSGIVVYFYNSDALKLLERRPMCSCFAPDGL